MDLVLRAAVMFLLLMVLFRIFGKRSVSTLTTFDFILLLVIGEATQQALIGDDFSMTTAAIVIVTLIGLDRISNYVGYRFPRVDRVLESVPVILVDDGEPLKDRMDKAHVSHDEILSHARKSQGLESMAQVKYAVLEKDGGISIIPR